MRGIRKFSASCLRSIRTPWQPEAFRLHSRPNSGALGFEGCYFKLVDQGERSPLALVAGLILGRDKHAFVQVLDGATQQSWYHRFPLGEFWASSDRLHFRIGENHFHCGGITLALDRTDDKREHVLRGTVCFSETHRWPVTPLSPGTMGLYSFVPFIPCRHHFVSFNHALSGTLRSTTEELEYGGGRGYLEKTWGSSFPESYWWVQANHFEREDAAVVVALASIPWGPLIVRSLVAAVLVRGRLYRFLSPLGSFIEGVADHGESFAVAVRNLRGDRLELTARKAEVSSLTRLRAPYDGRMTPRVVESMRSTVDVRLIAANGREILCDRGRNACLEMQGEQMAANEILRQVEGGWMGFLPSVVVDASWLMR